MGQSRLIDLTGRRFGRLVVLALATPGRNPKWACRCDCGNEKNIQGSNLGRATTSCGCAHSEELTARSTRHGGRGLPEYKTWCNMKQRCFAPTTMGFARYGGRGITVCGRWRDDFAAFLADMGPRPSAGHSIDRIDVDGDYEPGNCRWATRKEQMANMSRNRFVELDGELVIHAEAARRLGLTTSGLQYRMHKGALR
jgi:hypothetical protein